ncbi:MAG: SMP-30/gluconolactonase/LRE family protein [Gammaproteobacteria bacterium]|nr:MAG: SMP-30/gluconolactonase/LRE family protein [Gammaproteobacteria bacterium]
MNTTELIAQIPCANILGEGVQWNHREQAVWWTDIKSSKIYRYHLTSEQLQTWDTPEAVGCFAFAKNDERLLLALASGFAWFDKNTGAVEWIAKPEAHLTGNRLNDGRVDRQGRFWCGSIVEQKTSLDQSAGLFKLDENGKTTQHLSGLTISNSLCWSLDSKKLYHADSPSHQIKVYDFEAQSGTLGQGELFVQTRDAVEPDGSCIDAEGCLWNAEWGGSRLVRYNAEGTPIFELKTEVSQPTCMAFGGDDMNLLFVTSARIGLSEEALAAQPQAGNLFIYRTSFKGVNECWYAGLASQ